MSTQSPRAPVPSARLLSRAGWSCCAGRCWTPRWTACRPWHCYAPAASCPRGSASVLVTGTRAGTAAGAWPAVALVLAPAVALGADEVGGRSPKPLRPEPPPKHRPSRHRLRVLGHCLPGATRGSRRARGQTRELRRGRRRAGATRRGEGRPAVPATPRDPPMEPTPRELPQLLPWQRLSCRGAPPRPCPQGRPMPLRQHSPSPRQGRSDARHRGACGQAPAAREGLR
mmetsp:Transcript_95475/g.308128  ORF Transcript_95475/g.308128 Transcript_95475/m.308128 type:complete len:228 (-) Transcript_95475:562-1245(-)